MPAVEAQLRHLATTMLDLSGLRDRPALEQRLVAGLADLLAPRSVALLAPDADAPDADAQQAEGLADDDRQDADAASSGWRTLQAWPDEAATRRADPLRRKLRSWVVQTERTARPAEQPALLIFPLLHGHVPIALLEIERDPPCDSAERALIEQLLRLYGNLRRLLDDNECDELTGLLNRKTFDESFMRLGPLRHAESPVAIEEIGPTELLDGEGADERRARPERGESWLAVVDVDHFKRVNDQYGHLVGDEVLLLLSQLMRDTFRHEDRLYRFGGEEFVVLLRCPAASGARAALERLRRRVAERDFPQVGQLTISIGYTCIGADDTPERAFGRADQAVYHAKQAGRNQVHEHAELVALGLLSAPEPASSGVDFF
ncbi:GGDEF domain-containing protein [Leptothrix sp. BB-4]